MMVQNLLKTVTIISFMMTIPQNQCLLKNVYPTCHESNHVIIPDVN